MEDQRQEILGKMDDLLHVLRSMTARQVVVDEKDPPLPPDVKPYLPPNVEVDVRLFRVALTCQFPKAYVAIYSPKDIVKEGQASGVIVMQWNAQAKSWEMTFQQQFVFESGHNLRFEFESAHIGQLMGDSREQILINWYWGNGNTRFLVLGTRPYDLNPAILLNRMNDDPYVVRQASVDIHNGAVRMIPSSQAVRYLWNGVEFVEVPFIHNYDDICSAGPDDVIVRYSINAQNKITATPPGSEFTIPRGGRLLFYRENLGPGERILGGGAENGYDESYSIIPGYIDWGNVRCFYVKYQ